MLLVYFASFAENSSLIIYAVFVHFVIVIAACSWVLKRKGQSQWDLGYVLLLLPFSSLAIIIVCMFRTNKRDEISHKPQLHSIPPTISTATDTLDRIAYDKGIEHRLRKTWKPIVAGILDIVSAVLVYLFTLWVLYVFIMDVDLETLVVGIAYASVATLALIGGVFALKREKWGLVLAGSIAVCAGAIYLLIQTSKPFEIPAVFAWLGIPAFILIAFSKHEFKR